MPKPENIFAEPLETCSLEPRAGFGRAGNAETALQAIGSHIRCDPADPTCHPEDLS